MEKMQLDVGSIRQAEMRQIIDTTYFNEEQLLFRQIQWRIHIHYLQANCISFLRVNFNILLGNYHNFNKKLTHKTGKKPIFCSFFNLIRLNKHVGRNISNKSINVLFLIRECWMENFLKNK